ncbi:helix-turn-helix domain-containing protein [Lysobacter sp. GX 14042]|uniref:helix-turn-helix domain-containing protein n=1 Tax=Lysobacter sp. GX 14042 TaxID=2907155 RepID=UPI001F23354C|nr:helix-turn-helix domain-containing protein [Lysobacter sp. GX 14042]MCE7031352.1 helix-turn-helix domain-containing protein [Lysobacter sp. GX 14042]
MDRLNELIDQAKIGAKASSDAAFAKALGVSRASVSNWRHGRNYPDTVQCARISELSGEPLQRVLGVVGEARALSADEKKVWRRLAEVAVIACAVMLPALPTQAATVNLNAGHDMHYAKSGLGLNSLHESLAL